MSCMTHSQRVTKQHAHEGVGGGGRGNNMKWQMRRKADFISVWKVAAQRRWGGGWGGWGGAVVFKTGPFPPWDGRIKAENEIRLSSGDIA